MARRERPHKMERWLAHFTTTNATMGRTEAVRQRVQRKPSLESHGTTAFAAAESSFPVRIAKLSHSIFTRSNKG